MNDVLLIAGVSFVGWLIASLVIHQIQGYPFKTRIAVHYVSEFLVFGGLFLAFFTFHETSYGLFSVVLTCMLSLLCYELLAWAFWYRRVPWYYGLYHWWLPSYIISAAIVVSRVFAG